MQFQPTNAKSHKGKRRQRREERKSEDRQLTALKARIEDALSERQPTLFAAHIDGRVNAA